MEHRKVGCTNAAIVTELLNSFTSQTIQKAHSKYLLYREKLFRQSHDLFRL